MLRMTGLAIIGTAALGALATLGSDRWISAGYTSVSSHTVSPTASVGDEAYWLGTARPKGVTPVATDGSDLLAIRAFEVGTRLTISGGERLNLDIISSSPVPLQSGLTDASGRPLILVTARERKGTRIVRFLVEADPAPLPRDEKSL